MSLSRYYKSRRRVLCKSATKEWSYSHSKQQRSILYGGTAVLLRFL